MTSQGSKTGLRFFFIKGAVEVRKDDAPVVSLHLGELLARRLDALNRYVVDSKGQFAGHDRLGMVDSVLETLLNRQMRARVRLSESTIRHGQLPD